MPPQSSQPSGKRKLVAHYPPINVEITQHHIDVAIPEDSSHCMIADAIRSALPQARNISVDLQAIRFTDPDKAQRYIYFTPTIGQGALVAFDEGRPLVPFSFTLRSPIQVVAAGKRQRGESRVFEGMRTTTASKLGVQIGGRPLPSANLYHGPGSAPSPTKYAGVTEPETDPFARKNRPDDRISDTGEPEPIAEETRPGARLPETAVDTYPVAEEFRRNVTLATGGGRRRKYGMHQLRPPSIPRYPGAS